MWEFKYKPPRVHNGELRTRVTFYEYEANNGPLPGEKEKKILYEAWAKIDQVWSKDIEIAKANGTLSDLTITIRDPRDEFSLTNRHYIQIHAPEYETLRFNVKQAMPDLQNHGFIKAIAEVST
ncbi:phage head-tail adapter protein [Priestia megaterium]|uniref:phage head-tail adapter protein n=1 Tax=Priestia megaterium TaxID=1404 RepID=UPI0026E2DF78|nr:phage head-tail adapter protein [Priestia megaterium]MDO6849198.1 phage head-tail adapter protein [Priestia megaterium]